MRSLSVQQTVIAVAGLLGITVLAALDKVSGEVVSVIYTAVIAGALGYVNGKKAQDVIDASRRQQDENEAQRAENRAQRESNGS